MMRMISVFGLVGALLAGTDVGLAFDGRAVLNPQLRAYVGNRELEFEQIPAERKRQLEKVAAYVMERLAANEPARLTFICTHNSRRSHFAQLWSAAAAVHYGIRNVETFSGGTEATAFNPRAVAALERAGFDIERQSGIANPRYSAAFANGVQPQICFSKVYNEAPNPTNDFCAVMTCSQADEACPVVNGASLRMAIPYKDPKISDGTAEESQVYDERCAQIAREMLYLFGRVKVE